MLFRRKSHTPFNERVLGFKSHAFYMGGFMIAALYIMVFGVIGDMQGNASLARASFDSSYQNQLIERFNQDPAVFSFMRDEVRADPQEATNNLDRALDEHKREVSRPAQPKPKPKPKPPETLDSHLRENYPLQMQAFDEKETRLKTAKTAEERALIEKIYILKSDFVFNMEQAQHYKSAVARYQNKPDLWRDAIARNQAKFSKHDSAAKSLRRQILDLEKQLADMQKPAPKITLQLSPEDAAKFNNSLNQ